MAIVIEQEKKNEGGFFGFVVFIVVVAIIGFAIYYLFFVSPELISTAVPVRLKSIDELQKMDFRPSDLISGDFFQSLKQIQASQRPPAGNSAPFGIF